MTEEVQDTMESSPGVTVRTVMATKTRTALVANSVWSLRKRGRNNDSGGGDSTPLPFGHGRSHLDFSGFR